MNHKEQLVSKLEEELQRVHVENSTLFKNPFKKIPCYIVVYIYSEYMNGRGCYPGSVKTGELIREYTLNITNLE